MLEDWADAPERDIRAGEGGGCWVRCAHPNLLNFSGMFMARALRVLGVMKQVRLVERSA